MLSQFFEYARYLKPVMKLFIAALAAGALAAAASGFGFPLMIAKVFPVVFDNTQIPPELQDMIASGEPAEVSCHFCNESYRFEAWELKEILAILETDAPDK